MDEYALLVGSVVINLQSLEFMLRMQLTIARNEQVFVPSEGGDEVEENSLTNFASVGQLVRQYNAQLQNGEGAFRVDEKVVEIRDALAHGRTLGREEGDVITLFTFEKPACGKVVVKAITRLTRDRLATWRQQIAMETAKLVHLAKQRGLAGH